MNHRTASGRILFSAVSVLIACLVARVAAANVDLVAATPSPVDRPSSAPREAAPEAGIAVGTWEVFTDGRMGGFASYVNGDAYPLTTICLLYTSDAADERSSVDLGGRRII